MNLLRADIFSQAWYLNFCLTLHLHLYFLSHFLAGYGSSSNFSPSMDNNIKVCSSDSYGCQNLLIIIVIFMGVLFEQAW